ncbi:unnamed protein product [Prorocentrum cordatum]|uniref:Uncharacterized protein n=1 Tax=Prorocentrum cordatum TaxID=2364126 RepID=A0ABN9TZP2_9DINO|nr:unnamed protein product [Polarella glacialis]
MALVLPGGGQLRHQRDIRLRVDHGPPRRYWLVWDHMQQAHEIGNPPAGEAWAVEYDEKGCAHLESKHIEIADAVGEWLEVTDPQRCEYFLGKLLELLMDLDMEERITEEGIAGTVLKLVKEHPAFTNRYASASSSRFMGAVTRAIEGDAVFALRGLGFSILNAMRGNVDPKKFLLLEQTSASITVPAGAAPLPPTKQASNQVSEMRKATKDASEIAMLMHENPDNRFKQRIIASIGERYKKAFGDRSRRCRSVEGAVKWQLEALRGTFFNPICGTFDIFNQPWELEHIGLSTTFRNAPALDLDHPMVRRDLENFRKLDGVKDAFIKKVVRRSTFSGLPGKQLSNVCEEAGFEPTPRLLDWAKRKQYRIVGSRVCEDAGNRARRAQEKAKTNEFSASKVWETLIRKEVLSKVHKFQDLCTRGQRTPRNPKLPKKMYKPAPRSANKRIKLSQIISFSSTPPWNSPGVANSNQCVADAYLTEWAIANDKQGDMRYCWMCAIAGKGLLLLRQGGAANPWFAVLGNESDVVLLVHPVVEDAARGVYKLAVDDDAKKVHAVVICNPADVEAIPVAVDPPVNVYARNGADAAAVDIATMRAPFKPIRGPENLYRAVAREAFYDFKLPFLREVGKVGVPEFDRTLNLFETLRILVQHFLPELAPGDLSATLQKRTTASFFNFEEFYELDECDDVIPKDDQKKARQKVKDYKSMKLETDEFTEHWLEYNRKVHALPERAEPDASKPETPLHRCKGPLWLPKGAITQPEASRMCPPNASIWRCNAGTGGWHVHPMPYPRWSRPWVPFGHDKACQLVLQYAWVLWLRDNRLRPGDCPIDGLFTLGQERFKDVLDAVFRGDMAVGKKTPCSGSGTAAVFQLRRSPKAGAKAPAGKPKAKGLAAKAAAKPAANAFDAAAKAAFD